MVFRRTNLGLAATMILAGVPGLLAQGTQTATIVGTVVDAKGNPVAEARVKLASPAMQGERQLMTDAQGRFRAPLLPPGDYRITISKEGVTSVTLNQRLGVEQVFTPKVVLKETAGAVVEVVAGALAVDKSEFKTAQNYSKEAVDALPVSRSNLLDIAYLSPSVVQNVNADRGGVQIRGSMGTGNLMLVDGQNVMDNVYAGQRIGIIFDAVEETQVLTGALPAEYGDVEGGVINSITKSGGDEFTASLRWDLSNPAWNAVKPMSSRDLPNLLSNEMSLQVGGPIIKSKLWFFLAGFSNKPNYTKVLGDGRITADGLFPSGQNYNDPETDIRREVKLTWAINENHTLTATYNNNDVRSLKDYGAGEVKGLTALHTNGEFWSLALRSILSPKLTMNIRFGEKKQILEGGGLGNPADLILYNEDDGYAYNNGWFNPKDPSPDHRDNKTANLKFTYFWDWLGTHQLDAGIDSYQGTTIASGDQGPGEFTYLGQRYNIWDVNVYNLDTVARTAEVDAGYGLDVGEYHPDKVTANTLGYYVNDRWTLDSHWSFQIGARLDTYDAKSRVVGKIASHSSFSPRLGAKFDLLGDSVWIFGASWAKYNGRVLETILQNVSFVNNEIWKSVPYIGPSGPVDYSVIYDLGNYDFSSMSTNYAGPINVRIPRNLKPQQVAETQLSASHTHRSDVFGNGYLKLTLVQKDWDNLIDFTQGNSGHVDYLGEDLYVRVYQNNPKAKRKYQAMELEGNTVRGNWTFGGNIVWSKLEGNYVGESSGSPGRGQGLDFFRVQDGVTMYNGADFNPSGRLPGDVPLRMRLLASYSKANSLGKINWGLAYRFDSGAHDSFTRKVPAEAINAGLSGEFGSSGVQYLGQTRGNNIGQAQSYLDLSVQQDFQVFGFKNGRAVTGYVKLDVRNLLNHTQVISVDRSFAPAETSVNDPWVPANSTFGSPAGPANFGEPRQVRISTGLRF